jgi:hypothetical protein
LGVVVGWCDWVLWLGCVVGFDVPEGETGAATVVSSVMLHYCKYYYFKGARLGPPPRSHRSCCTTISTTTLKAHRLISGVAPGGGAPDSAEPTKMVLERRRGESRSASATTSS